jgi:hypothetical protein
MANGQVYSPTHRLSRLESGIEEIMDADPYAGGQGALSQISWNSAAAVRECARLLARDRLGEGDPEVTCVRTLLDFMEGKE